MAGGVPSLELVLAGRTAQAANMGSYLHGSDYAPDYPHNLVDSSGYLAIFSPAWSKESPDATKLAYAIYLLDAAGLAGGDSLHFNWSRQPAAGSDLWIGLGNFETERWEFSSGLAAREILQDDWTPFIDAGTNAVMVLVVALGSESCRLTGLGFSPHLDPVPAWPMFGQNPSHDCRTSVAGPEEPNRRWTFDLNCGEECYSSAAVSAEGIVYIAGNERLHAFDGADGTELWWLVEHGVSERTPAVSTAVVTTEPGKIQFIALDGSAIRERGMLGGIGGVTLAPDLGVLIPWNNSGLELAVWDPLTGQQLAGIPIPSPAVTSPATYAAIDGTGAYYANTMHQLNRILPDGILDWGISNQGYLRFSLSGPSIGSDGTTFIFGRKPLDSLCLMAFEPADGENRWTTYLDCEDLAVPGLLSDGRIIALCGDNHVRAYEPLDGSLSWEFDLGGSINAETSIAPAIDGNNVTYIGCSTGRLYAINPDGTEKWHYEAGSAVYSSPAIGPDGTVYITEMNGILHAVGDVAGPSAHIEVTPRHGPAPLDVLVDCSQSTDSAGIASYDYDWDADGIYDLVGGGAAEHHTFEAGVHQVRIRVTNTFGAAHAVSTAIQAGPFIAEAEPNDSIAEADQWPELSFPADGFTGHVGPLFGEKDDNSSPDIFRFQAAAGSTVSVTGPGSWIAHITVIDADQNVLAEGELNDGEMTLVHTFTGETAGPYYIRVWAGYLWHAFYEYDINLLPAAP